MLELATRELGLSRRMNAVIGILLFAVATVLGGWVRIPLPFTPVPITLQTFFVLLAGMSLGSGKAAMSQVLYLLFGAFGAPLFSNLGSGAGYLLGPTGGYLVGFILAAGMLGHFVHGRNQPLAVVLLWLLLAETLLFACGVAWLAALTRQDLSSLLVMGVAPFVPGEAVKIALAAVCFMNQRGRLNELF